MSPAAMTAASTALAVTVSPMEYFRKAPFPAKVNGIQAGGRQQAARQCYVGEDVTVRHEPENPYDACALAVFGHDGRQLGYVPAAMSSKIVETFGKGLELPGMVTDVYLEHETPGLRILIDGTGREALKTEAPVPEDPRSEDPDPAALTTTTTETSSSKLRVFSRSGRDLGSYVRTTDGKVVARKPSGVEVPFAVATVEIRDCA